MMVKTIDKNLYGPAEANFHTDKWDNPIISGGMTRLEKVALELLKASISDGKVDINRRLEAEVRNSFICAKEFLRYAQEDFEENGSCLEQSK